MKHHTLPIAAFAAVLLATPASAQLTSSSPLLDSDGTVFNNNTIATNETGWDSVGFFSNSEATDPLTIQSGSLSYTDGNSNTLVTGGNKAVFDSTGDTTGDNDNTFSRYRPTNDYSGASFWVSGLVQSDGAFVSFQVRDNAGQSVNINTSGQPDLISDGPNDSNFGPALSQGQTYLLVGHYTSNPGSANDTYEAWINPDIGGTSPANALANGSVTLSSGAGDLALISEIRVLFNGNSGSNGAFDEVRVGNSFADVTPIPEPSSTAALLGGLGLALVILRRRRS